MLARVNEPHRFPGGGGGLHCQRLSCLSCPRDIATSPFLQDNNITFLNLSPWCGIYATHHHDPYYSATTNCLYFCGAEGLGECMWYTFRRAVERFETSPSEASSQSGPCPTQPVTNLAPGANPEPVQQLEALEPQHDERPSPTAELLFYLRVSGDVSLIWSRAMHRWAPRIDSWCWCSQAFSYATVGR